MKGKRIREKGKIGLSKYFRKYSEGESVAIVKDEGMKGSFPRRIIGKSGKIIGFRGSYILVKIRDGSKIKTFIIHPIHLKRLE